MSTSVVGAVRSGRSARSAAAPRSRDDLEATVAGLVDRVTRRMRARNRVGRTVVLRLRFDDFTPATRSHTLARSTARRRPILTALQGLLDDLDADDQRRGITLLGIR